MTIRIVKRERPGRGIRRVAIEQVDSVIAVLEDPHLAPELKVHECRKCCKFLRALLLLNLEAMGEDRKTGNERFRDIARLLGDLRDEHVQAGILAQLEGRTAPPVPGSEAGLDEALARFGEARPAIEAWPLTAADIGDILPGYVHTYARCRQAWKRAGQGLSDHDFHRFRKWAKYHRYQVEVLELVNRAEMRKRARSLELLGDLLGDAHDLAELQAKLEVDGGADPRMVANVVKRKQALYRQSLAIGQKRLGRRPQTVAAELARWWKAWRH